MLPRFSVVIPTYRRPHQLHECLRSIAALEYPRDRFEVLVVDDGGDVPLDPVVRPFADQVELSLLRQPNAGPARARNAAAGRARGDLLAFTDDDCRVEPRWLAELARAFTDSPDCLVGGHTVNEAPGIYSAASQLIVDVVYRHYNADPRNAGFIASNNMAVAARSFREIGGFDPDFRFAEDRELCGRWRYAGRRILYHPAARVRHTHPLDAASFCRQHFGYGRGAGQLRRRRRERGWGTMLNESRFHLDLGNWIGYPLGRVPRGQACLLAALLGLWQAANLAGFVWEMLRPRRAGAPR